MRVRPRTIKSTPRAKPLPTLWNAGCPAATSASAPAWVSGFTVR